MEEHREERTYLSVSATFYSGADTDLLSTDVIIVSSDAVFFYVHSGRLLAASENGFNQHLPDVLVKEGRDADLMISLLESSAVVNILLHTIYGMSCSSYAPAFEDLASAVAALTLYGMSLQTCIAVSSPLHMLLLTHAPTSSLELYALAASYGLNDLAVTASSYLLSISLPSITDQAAKQIGAVYLKRLFFLHLGRTNALKRLLLRPPPSHAPTATCDFFDQKSFGCSWVIASAYLTWETRPDLTASAIKTALGHLNEHLTCARCKAVLKVRISDLLQQWSEVKRTI